MKRKHFSYKLTSTDTLAIMAAMPLVITGSAYLSSEFQADINARLATSAMEKLQNHDSNFLPNEIRVIGCAVFAAYFALRGECPFELSAEDRAAISPYFFTYNKLYPIFDEGLPDK